MIIKKGVRDMFLFVPVDKYKHMLPSCVTHVPTVITRQKDVLTGEYIDAYINKNSGGGGSSDTTSTQDISPYAFPGGGYSSSYTWLTDNGYDDGSLSTQNEGAATNGFGPYGSDSRIFAPKEPDTSKSGKFDDSIYEKFLNSRNSDDEVIKRNINQNQNQNQTR
jgi:hypothetical protein